MADETSSTSTYVVLRRISDTDTDEQAYAVVHPGVTASSAENAIRHVAGRITPDNAADTFVAVPSRSWKPVTVRAETTTVIKFDPS